MNKPNSKKVAHIWGDPVGRIISRLVSCFLITTIFWGLIVYYIKFSVTWEQVFGVYMIFTIITEYIIDRVYNYNYRE